MSPIPDGIGNVEEWLVPRVGIEPTLLSEPDFESGASTNFTTEARRSPAGAGNASRIIADLTPSGNRGPRLQPCIGMPMAAGAFPVGVIAAGFSLPR